MNNFWNFPDKYLNNLLLIDPDNKRQLTYLQVQELSDNAAEKIRSDKKLAFMFCRNDYITVIYYLAILKAGHSVLLLDNKLNEEIKSRLINIYTPELIFAPSEFSFPGYSVNKIDEEMIYFSAEKPFMQSVYPDTSVLLSTSGTTGSPKLVRLTGRNIQANAESIVEYLEIDENERAITSLPMSYSFGLSVINTHILAGASLLMTDKSFVFKNFWDLFRKQQCTSFAGVPYSYELLKKTNFEKMELPSLRTLTQAGGRLSPLLIKYYSDLAISRGFRFFVMYGQTEATARISYVPSSMLPEKIGSIGVPIPGGKMKIYSEGEEVFEPNIEGELIYEGDNVMLGYSEERNDLSKGDELKGKLYTGDIAYKDKDNFFHITGRLKRFIKIFGLRLNLDEVEKMIESHYGIFNACSGSDDKLNILIDKGDLTTVEDIRQKVSTYYKLNKSVVTVRLAEKMPVTESGKKDYSAISKFF